MFSIPPAFSLKPHPWQQERGCSVWSMSCSDVPGWAAIQSTQLWAVIPDHGSRNTCRGGGRGVLTAPLTVQRDERGVRLVSKSLKPPLLRKNSKPAVVCFCQRVICCRRVCGIVQVSVHHLHCGFAAWKQPPFTWWNTVPGNGLAPSYNGSSTNPPWALQFRKAPRPVKVDLRGGFWWEKMLQQWLVCFLN